MARYRCTVCGDIYDEEYEGVRFEDLPEDWTCPTCCSPKSAFVLMDDDAPDSQPQAVPAGPALVVAEQDGIDISLPQNLIRYDGGVMDDIHAMSMTGRSVDSAMDTELDVPGFEDILFLGAQLARAPKDKWEDVSIRTVIGKGSRRPMELEMPVYISHMSFGALSGRAKIALSKGSAIAGTAMCSGEGGALWDEMAAAHRYIFEYIPNQYSFNDLTLEHCDAIEIKIGQGTKPGMGGHLPGDKVTEVIAVMRGKRRGEDILSPSKFPGIDTPEDLRSMVDMLRERSGGLPIGVKIAAGHIEEDLGFISSSGCDFITIDGRGGATGSSPRFLKDASSVPTVYALSRARRYMDEHGMDQDLVITGGFRTSGDCIKALAMGADAVAMASAPLMALGCQRYRACNTGKCPMGIATQDPELEARLDQEAGAIRVGNFLGALADEIRAFLRASGHAGLDELSLDDLCTVSTEISENTGIRHA